jgi:hypothetical protein
MRLVNADQIASDGFTTLVNVMSESECRAMTTEITGLLENRPRDAIESGKGGVVGGRNLIDQWSGWRAIAEKPVVRDFVRTHVGPAAGLVRILFFDKPPGRGWSLSMHRDRTIAVAQHQQPPGPFAKPTTKAGVAHVEASEELLSRMLTLRLHLDQMHEDNGPVLVIAGSHRQTETEGAEIQTIHCQAGDVFVMRPLLLHGSRASKPDTADHRRVVHLEIAPEERLPGAYRWHRYEKI